MSLIKAARLNKWLVSHFRLISVQPRAVLCVFERCCQSTRRLAGPSNETVTKECERSYFCVASNEEVVLIQFGTSPTWIDGGAVARMRSSFLLCRKWKVFCCRLQFWSTGWVECCLSATCEQWASTYPLHNAPDFCPSWNQSALKHNSLNLVIYWFVILNVVALCQWDTTKHRVTAGVPAASVDEF